MVRIAATFTCCFMCSDKVKNEGQEGYNDVSISVLPIILEEAIAAAINFVKFCCQQTKFMAGRGNIQDSITIMNASMYIHNIIALHIVLLHFIVFIRLMEPGASTISKIVIKTSDDMPRFCLILPGKQIDCFAPCQENQRPWYKNGAIEAFKELHVALAFSDGAT